LNRPPASVNVSFDAVAFRTSSGLRAALAAPSLADDNPPTPGTQHAVPSLPQADWKLLAGFTTWEPEKRNRIFYARVPAQTTAWKLHLFETQATRKALHQNFSRYGLLAIFLTDRQVFSRSTASTSSVTAP
jgi:hypothetical protein